jgi:hypothetical protein
MFTPDPWRQEPASLVGERRVQAQPCVFSSRQPQPACNEVDDDEYIALKRQSAAPDISQ